MPSDLVIVTRDIPECMIRGKFCSGAYPIKRATLWKDIIYHQDPIPMRVLPKVLSLSISCKTIHTHSYNSTILFYLFRNSFCTRMQSANSLLSAPRPLGMPRLLLVVTVSAEKEFSSRAQRCDFHLRTYHYREIWKWLTQVNLNIKIS